MYAKKIQPNLKQLNLKNRGLINHLYNKALSKAARAVLLNISR